MEGKTASKQSIARVVMPVIAVAFLLWDHYETQQAIKDTFSFDCQVTVVDAETGKHLNPSFIGWNNAARGRDLFPQSVTTTSRSGGSATLRGITSLPKSFVFSTPGYVSEELIITTSSGNFRAYSPDDSQRGHLWFVAIRRSFLKSEILRGRGSSSVKESLSAL